MTRTLVLGLDGCIQSGVSESPVYLIAVLILQLTVVVLQDMSAGRFFRANQVRLQRELGGVH